jgi:hypothetical protein
LGGDQGKPLDWTHAGGDEEALFSDVGFGLFGGGGRGFGLQNFEQADSLFEVQWQWLGFAIMQGRLPKTRRV